MNTLRFPSSEWLFTLLFLLSAFCGRAQDAASAFNEANHLFEQQRFSEAATAYEGIIAQGKVSAPLYFNLGNAHFKAGQVGRAIAAFREASEIAPRDPDVRANLQFARDQVQNSKPPQNSLWARFLSRLTLNEWTVLAVSFFWLWFVLLSVAQWKRAWQKMLRPWSVLFAVMACFFIICTLFAVKQSSLKTAVVVANEAVVRRGPFAESQSAYPLRDGAELRVLDQRQDWVQVADTGNRVGWIPKDQVVIVH